MSKEKDIIGLTGLTKAGKSEVARVLHELHGFEKVSLSEILKGEAEDKYGSFEREVLERVYEELGEEALAQKMILLVEESEQDKTVIDSIRSVKLLEMIKNAFEPDFYFVGVAASKKERFRRMQKQNKSSESMTWGEFVRLDLLQLGEAADDVLGYQVRQCFSRADIIVENNSESLEDLEEKVGEFLDMLGIE